VLRSKTPDLVRQEFYGLLLAHFAIRGLMHEAALSAGEDPTGSRSSTRCASSGASSPASPRFPPRDRPAFHAAVLRELVEERVVSSRGRHTPGG